MLDKAVSDSRRPNTVAISLAQAAEKMSWRYTGDVGLLVGVGGARNGIVAVPTALEPVEDDANEDYQEEGTEGGAQGDQHHNAFGMMVAWTDVSAGTGHETDLEGTYHLTSAD